MIVIHVGLKKSGSSSIQHFFSANEKSLRELLIEYPRIGRVGEAHRNIALEILHRNQFDPKFGTLSQLSEYWRSSPSETMVLSSELFEGAERPGAATLKKSLVKTKKNDRFRIMLILRELIDLMPSSYGQKVTHGDISCSFDVFFSARMKERRVHYFDTASIWADTFGWSNIRIRPLDRQTLLNGDLIDDFVSVAGLRVVDGVGAQLHRPGIRNTMPGWKVLEGKRSFDPTLLAAARLSQDAR